MKTLLGFILLLNLSVWGAEIVPHGKDLVITVHEKSPEEDKKENIPELEKKSCCSNCDIRLKLAIITAATAMTATICSTAVAVKYHC